MTDSTAAAGAYTGRTAWARNLEEPVRLFLRTETGGAAILLAASVAALIWVNIDAASYARVWSTTLSVRIGGGGVTQSLREWINDGLMVFFFLTVGLEARREFDLGELRLISSMVLGVLVGFHRSTLRTGGRMRLIALQPIVREAIEQANLTTLLEIHESVDTPPLAAPTGAPVTL